MSDVFREVDEAVREDLAREWWKRHGRTMIGLAVAAVLAVAAFNAWRWYQTDQRAGGSMAFEAAVARLPADKPAGIAALEALASGGQVPYAGLARMRLAQAKSEAGDRNGAMEALAAAAGTGDDADLKDLAVLLRVMQGFEAAKPEDTATQLQALAVKDKPWRGLALELMAAAALKGNDIARARQLLAELRDDEAAPAGARARATELLSALGEAAPAK